MTASLRCGYQEGARYACRAEIVAATWEEAKQRAKELGWQRDGRWFNRCPLHLLTLEDETEPPLSWDDDSPAGG